MIFVTVILTHVIVINNEIYLMLSHAPPGQTAICSLGSIFTLTRITFYYHLIKGTHIHTCEFLYWSSLASLNIPSQKWILFSQLLSVSRKASGAAYVER